MSSQISIKPLPFPIILHNPESHPSSDRIWRQNDNILRLPEQGGQRVAPLLLSYDREGAMDPLVLLLLIINNIIIVLYILQQYQKRRTLPTELRVDNLFTSSVKIILLPHHPHPFSKIMKFDIGLSSWFFVCMSMFHDNA